MGSTGLVLGLLCGPVTTLYVLRTCCPRIPLCFGTACDAVSQRLPADAFILFCRVMPQPKVVGDASAELVADLFGTGIYASILRDAANAAISDRTRNSYRLAVKHVGGVSLRSFLVFLAAELAKPVRPDQKLKPGRGRNRIFRYATSTMRAVKSACCHMSFVTKTPWTSSESALAELALAGYEASNRSPSKRAALSVTMFQQYIAYVRERRLYDLEAGAEVMWACGLRPQDMHALCVDMCVLDDDGRVTRVYQKIKAPLHIAVRQGVMQLREVPTERAQELLQARYDAWVRYDLDYSEPFFPGFTTEAVSQVFAVLGRTHGWPQDVMFDGIHCFRHSMATSTLAAAMEQVRKSGAWKSMKSAKGYCAGVAGAGKARAARRRQQKKE